MASLKNNLDTTSNASTRAASFIPWLQVGGAIVIAAATASAMMWWGTRPTKYVASAEHINSSRPVLRVSNASSDISVATGGAPNAEQGKTLFGTTCFVCHGPTGAGMPGLGAPLRTSKFVALHSDDQLVAFIKQGRQPFDPDTVLHLTMPPKGGNPALDDNSLKSIVAFIRQLQADEKKNGSSAAASTATGVGGLGVASVPAKPAPN